MAISEDSRHQLYNRLDEVLGRDEAATLMAHLPPVGWAEVATKRDLDALEARMELRFTGVDQRFAGVDQRFDGVDQRFDGIDKRLDGIDKRLDGIDKRLDGMDKRLDGMDVRFSRIDDRLERMGREMRSNLVVSLTASAAMLGAVVAAIRL